MKRLISFLTGAGTLFVALPVSANEVAGGTGMWDGYSNIANGFTIILVWIVLLLLIGVLWKNLHH